ncbi:hypothetical protein HY008_00610, partial [Candidatus Woesebacteria bacterium]|nr:hypothetical protein [Candidatus Woesebacteria bacterium]
MKTKPEDFLYFVDGIAKMDKDELNSGLESDRIQSEKEYVDFASQLKIGFCYLCGEKLIRCDKNKPCIHWLLRGHKRIKKKDVAKALGTKDLFQTISFLRWLAVTELNLVNV